MGSFPASRIAIVALLFSLGAVGIAHGEIFEFDLTSSSYLTVTGTISGTLSQNLTAQSTGSNTTTYSGPIFADITDNVITFVGGGDMVGANQSSNQQPAVGGASGNAPAVYGLKTSGLASGNVAVRDLAADVTSDALTIGAGGAFDSTGLTFSTIAGSIDYRISYIISTTSGDNLAYPNSASNTSSTASTLVDFGVTETLTIPVAFTLVFPVPLPGGLPENANITLTGQLVATRPLPPVPGDLDGNRIVNLSDFTVLKNEWLHTGSSLPADLNGDHVVDLSDFTIFKADYLAANPGAGVSLIAPVPEPSTAVMAIAAAALTAVPLWRKRRKNSRIAQEV